MAPSNDSRGDQTGEAMEGRSAFGEKHPVNSGKFRS